VRDPGDGARLVLEAAYEATFCAAIINLQSTGNPCLFLTRLGGGAFGNPPDWIRDALSRSVQQYEAYPLEVAVVNRGA
jgi:predicted NBD/HSP70 family sugar kinase